MAWSRVLLEGLTRSASEDILSLLWNQTVRFHVHESLVVYGRIIFRPKREGVTGGWREQCNEMLHKEFFSITFLLK